jgi:hypothetical protein
MDLTPNAKAKLAELSEVTHESASDLASAAVVHLHRTLIGMPAHDPDGPQIDTGPFRKRFSYQPAEVVLRQIDATNFRLEEPFQIIGDDGAPRWVVRERSFSDLASVPKFLTWLVPRYGRHTLAALLHDHLQSQAIKNPVSSAEADEVFRDAMADTGVPLLLRWLMWTAVSARTRKNDGGFGMVAALVWIGLYALAGGLGLPLLFVAVVAGWLSVGWALVLMLAVLVSPLVLGVLWRRDYPFAVVSALGVLVIGYAALVVVIVYAIYAGLETVSRPFQKDPKPIRATRLKQEQAQPAS